MKKIVSLLLCGVLALGLCSAAMADGQQLEYVYGENCYVAYDPSGGSTADVLVNGYYEHNPEGLRYRVGDGEEGVISYSIFPGEWVSFPKISELGEDERPYITPHGNSQPPTNILYIRCYIDGVPHDASVGFYEMGGDRHSFVISCDRVPEKASVAVPSFSVTLNGQAVDPAAWEYPILCYKDVVYLPMCPEYNGFLGLKSDCNSYFNRLTAAVTNGEITSQTLEIIPAVSENGGALTAEIKDYNVYLSSQSPVKNTGLDYPLLTFRDMTYLPLTWEVCQTLDWELSFDGVGLVLDTTDAFRPSWSSPQSHGMNAANYSVETYVLGDDCYAGYYIMGMSTDGSEKKLIWRRKGQPEKRFGAECLAALGSNVRLGYVNDEYGEKEYYIRPWLNGSVLNTTVVGYNSETRERKSYKVQIDMENEKLLWYEPLNEE